LDITHISLRYEKLFWARLTTTCEWSWAQWQLLNLLLYHLPLTHAHSVGHKAAELCTVIHTGEAEILMESTGKRIIWKLPHDHRRVK